MALEEEVEVTIDRGFGKAETLFDVRGSRWRKTDMVTCARALKIAPDHNPAKDILFSLPFPEWLISSLRSCVNAIQALFRTNSFDTLRRLIFLAQERQLSTLNSSSATL